jgi:hypothetical protein
MFFNFYIIFILHTVSVDYQYTECIASVNNGLYYISFVLNSTCFVLDPMFKRGLEVLDFASR